MSHLHTPVESPLYEADLARMGYVANYTRVFALAPDVYAAWRQLGAAVAGGMDNRRYELVTLAAARRLRSRYCSLAHAGVLVDRYVDADTLDAMVRDHTAAGLDPVDVAIMDFAAQIAGDPASATAEQVEALRRHGLSEADIFQVVLAVMARRFFAGTLDATGAVPDSALLDRTDTRAADLVNREDQ